MSQRDGKKTIEAVREDDGDKDEYREQEKEFNRKKVF